MTWCSTPGRHLYQEITRLRAEAAARPTKIADINALKVIAQELGDEGWVAWANHLWTAIEELERLREA